MNPVIVTDVRYRMSLPAIRALGRCGIPVISTERAGSDKRKALGFFSKYSVSDSYITDPDESKDGFIADLRVLANSCEAKPVILPIGISSVLTLSEYRDEVSDFADLAVAPIEKIELANDKSRLIPFAESIGIPVPKTTFKEENESLEAFAERLLFPAVIKLPKGEMLGLSPSERYGIVRSREEFLSSYPRFEKLDDDILVQQYIEGDGWGVSAVFDKNSEPLEIFCHRRIREYPSSGGPSCFCESVDAPELCDYAVKLLKSLSWVGVAMVEFKGSPEFGFYLMEINPRFWGSSALAPNSGCNIPLALYRAAKGEAAAPFERFTPGYKVGHKMRFLLQDLLAFPAYLKKSENKLSFALSFIGGLLNFKISDGVLDIRDIPSSLAYLRQALGKTDSIVR